MEASKSNQLSIDDLPDDALENVASFLSISRSARDVLPTPFTTHSQLHIDDLPKTVLANVASYLPKTTRALLAVAFTAPSSAFEQKGWKDISLSSSSEIVLANPYYGRRETENYTHRGDDPNYWVMPMSIITNIMKNGRC